MLRDEYEMTPYYQYFLAEITPRIPWPIPLTGYKISKEIIINRK